MVRRSGYPGVTDPDRRFEDMRSAITRLQALERDHAASTPYGAALNHAVIAIRQAANLLTRKIEFFGATGCADHARYARTVAEFDALRPTLADLQQMADAHHPATPEARSLNHAAMALRMAADVLTRQADFFRTRSSDGTSPPMR